MRCPEGIIRVDVSAWNHLFCSEMIPYNKKSANFTFISNKFLNQKYYS